MAGVVLVGGGAVLLSGLSSDSDTASDGSDGTVEGELQDTAQIETEQINAILSEAEEFAGAGNYEAALAKVQAGLMVYPDSTLLQAKAAELSNMMTQQIKDTILAEAETLAAEENYPAAIMLLQKAQTDHNGAVDFSDTISDYQDRHISAILSNADSLIEGEKYNAALVALKQGEVQYPNHPQFQEKIAEITALKDAAAALIDQSNPNQNPTPIRQGEDVEITGGTSQEQAVEIQREDIYHVDVSEGWKTHWYRFTGSDNYSVYAIALSNHEAGSKLHAELIDSSGNVFADQFVFSDKQEYLCARVFPNTEVWLKIQSEYKGWDGNYVMSVNEKICDAGYFRDGAFQISLDKQYTKTFDIEYFSDWYRFKTTSNYALYRCGMINNSIASKTIMIVYDEYETELARVEAGEGKTAIMDLKLEPGREYFVEVKRQLDTDYGYYQLAVMEMLCDAGLTAEEATPIMVDQPVYGVLDTTWDEWYVCTFTESGEYTLNITNNSINAEMDVTVYDMLGTNLGTLSAWNSASKEYSMPIEAGTSLRIKVSREGYDRYEFGNYTLLVTKSTGGEANG